MPPPSVFRQTVNVTDNELSEQTWLSVSTATVFLTCFRRNVSDFGTVFVVRKQKQVLSRLSFADHSGRAV
jgi:hypothetical protein